MKRERVAEFIKNYLERFDNTGYSYDRLMRITVLLDSIAERYGIENVLAMHNYYG